MYPLQTLQNMLKALGYVINCLNIYTSTSNQLVTTRMLTVFFLCLYLDLEETTKVT